MNRNRFSPAPSASATTPGIRSRRRRFLAGFGVLTLGTAALAGCAADSSLTPVADSSGDPFEAYLAEDMDAIFFAQDVLRFQCYADNGYPEHEAFIPEEPAVQWRTDLLDQLTVADAFFESVQDATATGLRGEPFEPSPAKIFVHDAAFEPVAEACNTKAWAAMGEDAEESLIEYNRLSSKHAGGQDRIYEGLDSLQQEVVQCLVDAGEPVTPASDKLYGFTTDIELGAAVEYPERSGPKKSSGVEIVPADVEITYAPTPAEAALAVKYYNCSLETGVRDEFAALILETKKEVVAEHAAELEKSNPRIAELAAAARELTNL